MGKVRVYDLAKELKLDNRKVIEDARRLGVDVSVPSNTLDDPIADKIREIYFPKKEQVTTHRTARLIKHAVTPADTPAGAPAEATAAAQVKEESVLQAAQPALVARTAELTPPAGDSQRPKLVKLPPAPPPPPPAVTAPPVMPAPTLAPVAAQRPAPAEFELEPELVVPEAEPVLVEIIAALPEIAAVPEPAVAAPDIASEPELPAQPRVAEVKVEEPPAEIAAIEPLPPALPAPPPPVHKPAPAVAPPPVHRSAPPHKPAPPPGGRSSSVVTFAQGGKGSPNRTNVIKLATPTTPLPKPLPKPVPKPPVKPPMQTRPQPIGTAGPTARAQRDDGRPGRKPAVHLLESGKPQLVTYVPPPDSRHKGRHGVRPKGEKQEGNQQRIQARRHPNAPSARAVPVDLKPVRLVEGSTVREFAEKLDAKPRDVVAQLMQRGVMATINQTINQDIAKDIGRFFGFDVSFGEFEDMVIESEFEVTPEAMADTDPRAPVITVMGHVDHGKTSLLDTIRQTRVAEGEAGGITQHIGAYSVEVPNPDDHKDLRRVVFLDTPGHEAFTMMRARGARVTDIVVLVVAADDGVMPQTIEAIDHAKVAKVPIVVAINKIDKGDANPDRVKKALADRGLLWDGWGGDTTMVEVSAKMKKNIDGLLEMILLTADLLDLKSNPKRMATGAVLEAKLDRGRGAVATVLVQNGSLKIGDPFIVGNYFGKVRALVNDRGTRIQEVGPAVPVEVLGLEGVPLAGDQFQVVSDIVKAQQISSFRQTQARTTSLARSAARGLDQLHAQLQAGEIKELLVILKADVQGSVEVLKDTLVKLSTEKVKVRIIRAGVGAVTYDDVLLASASNDTTVGAATVIIGFNVRPEARAENVAKEEGVDIRLHSIIYKVEEEIHNAMIGLLDATIKETVIGKAQIRDVIRVPKIGSIAGCMVVNGWIKRTGHARLIRDNVVIFDAHIGSLRRFKEDVADVQQGFECGITIERFTDYKIGDVIEAYITEKVQPTKL